MPRIVGIDIPKEKKIYVSLSYIYGIGRSNALKILGQARVSPDVRAKDLTEDEVSRLATYSGLAYTPASHSRPSARLRSACKPPAVAQAPTVMRVRLFRRTR